VVFVQMFDRICGMADIIKMSDDDLEYVTGIADVTEGLKMIRGTADTLVLITLGKNGAMVSYKDACWRVPTFNSVAVVDTTGCGDSFMAATIAGLLNGGGLASLSISKLTDIVTFANAAATIVGTRYGAANAMPHLREVDKFLSLHQNADVQDGVSEWP
jgi:fructokinase